MRPTVSSTTSSGLQCTARGSDDDFAALGQGGETLALADEDRHAELFLELPDLLADAGLRGKQRIGGHGDIQTVIDDGAQITDLLQVHPTRYNHALEYSRII